MPKKLNNGLIVLFSGMLVLLTATAVLLGWLFDLPVLVQIRPYWVPMVFNTAICCYLSGVALVLTFLFKYDVALGAQRAIGLVVFTITGLVLLQILFGFDFNIDSPDLHRALQPGYVHPGRMAPNSALSLMLFSIGLLVNSFKQWNIDKRTQTVQMLAILVAVLGWFGVLGYWINLEYLYNWTSSVRMSVPTAVCVTALGFGLFSLARMDESIDLKQKPSAVNKIYYTAAFGITLICLTTGVSGFATLAQRTDDLITDNLQQLAKDRRFFFNVGIRARSEQALLLSKTQNVSSLLTQLNQNPGSPVLKRLLVDLSDKMARNEVTAIAYEGLNGHTWPGKGTLSHPDNFRVAFGGDYPGILVWDRGYMLHSRLPVYDANNVIVGHILIEQRFDALNQLRENTVLAHSSRDMVLCSADGNHLNCFPSSTESKPFRVLKSYQQHRLPMAYALDDHKTGIMTALDYRGNRVMAAYGPIGDTGLGLVIKINVAEIYSPIRDQMYKAAFLVLALLLLGLWLVKRHLIPLISAIDTARSEAELMNARFIAATEGGFDSFYIYESVRNAKDEIVDFRCTYINQRGAELIARKPDEFLGKLLLAEMPFARGPMYFDRFKFVINSGESISDELQVDNADMKVSWLARQIVKLGDGIAITLRDISEQKRNETYMRHVAMHDVLTNLPNRALFEDRVKTAIEQAKREKEQVAIALIDLDYFKAVNDKLGHHVGDALLQEFAIRLTLNIRPSDTIARLGGDEFALVLPHITHPKGSSIVLTKLFKVLQQPVIAAGHKLQVSISVGIAAYPNDGADLETLVRRADEAMYNAKAAGRNNFQIYSSQKTVK